MELKCEPNVITEPDTIFDFTAQILHVETGTQLVWARFHVEHIWPMKSANISLKNESYNEVQCSYLATHICLVELVFPGPSLSFIMLYPNRSDCAHFRCEVESPAKSINLTYFHGGPEYPYCRLYMFCNFKHHSVLIDYKYIPVVYPGFRGWGAVSGREPLLLWRNKKFSRFSKSKSFKKLVKINENLQLMKILKENLQAF